LLKSLVGTKVVALGIGTGVDRSELEDIASSPQHVILVEDFNVLSSVEEQLRNVTCSGNRKHACYSFGLHLIMHRTI